MNGYELYGISHLLIEKCSSKIMNGICYLKINNLIVNFMENIFKFHTNYKNFMFFGVILIIKKKKLHFFVWLLEYMLNYLKQFIAIYYRNRI